MKGAAHNEADRGRGGGREGLPLKRAEPELVGEEPKEIQPLRGPRSRPWPGAPPGGNGREPAGCVLVPTTQTPHSRGGLDKPSAGAAPVCIRLLGWHLPPRHPDASQATRPSRRSSAGGWWTPARTLGCREKPDTHPPSRASSQSRQPWLFHKRLLSSCCVPGLVPDSV